MLLAACSTQVITTPRQTVAGDEALARPAVVVVQEFAVDPASVRVDTGIGGTVRRVLNGTEIAQARASDAEAVRSAIRQVLQDAITAMGLPVQAGGGPPPAGPHVEIRGRVVSIDEGDRTRRNVVGFGAGKSSCA